MVEEAWHAARLIPTSGINGAEEQERRAVSALLAVMSSVDEFGRTLLRGAGAPGGSVETYIEVPFKLGDKTLRPDGLIRVTRGSRSWTALVEVKTGKNELQPDQLEQYLDIAREQSFDSLISISNQIPPSPAQHPTVVDRRKLRKVSLHHWSWSQILATAVMQKEHRGVSDPDQAWILGELIRYLEHPKSGALDFDDMGADWVPLREAVHAGTLRAGDKTIQGVTSRFDALLRFSALHLGRKLGTDVLHHLSRKEQNDPALRAQSLAASLVEKGTLSGRIRIPDTVGDVVVTADLRASKVTFHVDIEAPKTGRATTRVNWLVRQLKNAPEALRLEAFVANQRGQGAAELLMAVREDPAVLIIDPAKELRSFRIAATVPMGTKRGTGRGSFIDSVLGGLETFYETVVQQLKAWAASPPKIRIPEEPPEDVRPSLVATAQSSQDGPETDDQEHRARPSSVSNAVEEQGGTEELAALPEPGPAEIPGATGAEAVAEATPGYLQTWSGRASLPPGS